MLIHFHCHTSFTLLTRLFYFKENAADLQRSGEESMGSSGEQHHRITGKKGTPFKFTGGCAVRSVRSQQKKEKLPLPTSGQNSECGPVSWTSFKSLAIGPGEPRSLHFWVSGLAAETGWESMGKSDLINHTLSEPVGRRSL